MAITIIEALKLKYFGSFQLLCGRWGLDHRINKIGILDHEIVGDMEGEFGQGDFVITSFTAARNDLSLLVASVKELVKSNASGLAIKNVYIKSLPPEIIELGNQSNFPIFMFDDTIYYEDVIAEINEAIRLKDDDALLVTKIDIVRKGAISRSMVRALALELNRSFENRLMVAFCKEKKYVDDRSLIRRINLFKFQVRLEPQHAIFKYRDGILLICTDKAAGQRDLTEKLGALIEALDITNKQFTIGISGLHHSLETFSNALNEAFYAVKAIRKTDSEPSFYTQIGIQQILLPFLDDDRLQNFCNQIIEPIQIYDRKHHTQLLETAIAYIENDQNLKNTAAVLFQHTNTIRYRIKKIQEVLEMTELEGGFYEQLSIAVKIYTLNNR
ncbi:MAG: PucR family transcriptional regulator ligand-binding domain-containing protein [Clostridia bacterium]|nr:PucR family transcriptional regulator ligand-binding domain-containing protein [Clostridia bacterium]